MSLRFVKSNGALSDDFLTAICGLYGKNVDNRYSRIDFVRSVFNGNPFGHSYAVFVFDDDRPVGCHAIVPIAVLSRGVLLRGGKFEAFFLEEGYRKQRAGAEHDKALPGVLLITLLQALAFERGVEVIFTLTTEKVGPLYRSK